MSSQFLSVFVTTKTGVFTCGVFSFFLYFGKEFWGCLERVLCFGNEKEYSCNPTSLTPACDESYYYFFACFISVSTRSKQQCLYLQ
jgi:hypothetical protein